MLTLSNIVKEYVSGDTVVRALDNISLCFRKNEFVSVLGHSGCGKTTLLNIIGGLDRYTSGDLRIKGVSTVKYKASDWDAYRNHSIGFVFQSFHLLRNLTATANVELPLIYRGICKRGLAYGPLTTVSITSEMQYAYNSYDYNRLKSARYVRTSVALPAGSTISIYGVKR